MTTANSRFTWNLDAVKAKLLQAMERMFDWFVAAPEECSVRTLETTLWDGILTLGSMILSSLLALRCRDCSLADIQSRNLPDGAWRFRLDRDYLVRLTTTFGRLEFPSFAYRDLSGPFEATRSPALEKVAPLRGKCRSSALLLELTCRAAADAPYRRAAEMLRFFSHDAIDLEDTTLSAHLVKVGTLVDRAWQYRPREQIISILTNRATRDRDHKPLLYASTDACALRRFVDDTTVSHWKMANGLRFWCVDRTTGETIHLGGEYTWLDCSAVTDALDDLEKRKLLPRDGLYGDLSVQIVVVTDGQPWIRERMIEWFKTPIAILDAYHLIERLGKDAKEMFGEGTHEARRWLAQAVAMVMGPSKPEKEARTRGGRKHNRRQPRRLPPGVCPSANGPSELLAHIETASVRPGALDIRTRLSGFIRDNLDRIAYRIYRWKGMQIGSGAMESLHRVAVQARIKLPGCRWLPETSTQIFAVRMMILADRWDDFWSQPDLDQRLSTAFGVKMA